nr:TetR/AcrR family transcriptional regulator [uncultured Actinoplanes sp.]
MGYHHGDLRAALIRASFEQLAAHGLQGFSVAAVARRAKVSAAAPYRHFPDRGHLLSAVSGAAAQELRTEVIAAADAAAPDPRSRLAAVAGAYVRYVLRTGAGFPVIFAAELYEIPDDARREQTRALITTLMELAAGCSSFAESMHLVELIVAVAHGYTSLFTDGFFDHGARSVDDVAARATDAARALIHPC